MKTTEKLGFAELKAVGLKGKSQALAKFSLNKAKKNIISLF